MNAVRTRRVLDTAGVDTLMGAAEKEAFEKGNVMRVVQGNASVLTGGTMVDPREIAAGEVRAGEVRAGEVQGATTHELSEGDVLAVPAGVPHQFMEVSEEFLYYVVKVEV